MYKCVLLANMHTWAYDRYQESERTRDAHQDAKRSLHGTEQRVEDVRVDRLHADEVCSEGETTTVTRRTGFWPVTLCSK
jgi:predicted acyl esterase